MPPLVAPAQVRANALRARWIALGAGLAPGVVAGVIVGAVLGSWVWGVVSFAVVVVAVCIVTPGVATPMALALLSARTPHEDELVRVRNLVEGLCPTFGLKEPTLRVVDDEVPNACSLGRRPDKGVLVVTAGLESVLEQIEMEGIVAHELAHLKRGDAGVSATALAVLAPIGWLSRSDRTLHVALGRGRELLADQVAVKAVRYPPGLARALGRLRGAPRSERSRFVGRYMAISRWVWVDPEADGSDIAGQTGNLDLTSVRVAALEEM
ncbi:MAG: M48 family metalloprotease [Acidimicrobiales bacterium]